MVKRRLSVLFLMFIIVGALAQNQGSVRTSSAAPLQQSNVLSNPSLEDPYESGAASGWGRWHQESQDPGACSGPYAFRPEWARETNSALVRDGFVSQHIGNQFDTWHAGIYQNVQVQPGTTYRFSFWAIGRASNEQYPVPSDTAVNLGVRAGIDPNGSALWSDADVVWGGSGSPHDPGNQSNWQQFTVEATAAGEQITVFIAADLRGTDYCRAHLDVWFDQAQLTEVGPPPTNTPPPQPTSPPQPTAPPAPAVTNTPPPPTPTDTSEVAPTDTAEPEPTATATGTPEPAASICVNAFADANANGLHEDEEGAMAGVSFTVARDGQIVGTGVSTGPQPICFEDLEPGSYEVAQSVPNTLQMTTGASAEVSLTEGQTVEIKFGSRQRAAEEVSSDDVPGADTTTPDPEGVPDVEDVEQVEEGSSLLAMSGLAALIVAIILLGVLLFYFLRRRA